MAIILGGNGVDAALTVGPNSITDGLVFHIDASNNSTILPIGGASLTNGVEIQYMDGLLGDGQRVTFNTGAVGLPYYVAANNGTFYTGHGLDENTSGELSDPIQLGEEYTLEIFVKPTWFGDYGTFWFTMSRKIGIYPTETVIGIDLSPKSIKASHYPGLTIDNTGGESIYIGSATFWHYAAVFSRITNKVSYYRNGAFLASTSDQYASYAGTRSNILTNITYKNVWPYSREYGDGYVGSMKAYNRALTTQEVYQNYIASRSRYTI